MNSNQVDKAPFLSRFTIIIIVAFIAAFVVWASYAVVDELARGDGKVIPLSKTQIIQASEAGVVQEIAVRLGERVTKGQLLIRLDDTTTSSSLEETQVRIQAYEAQIARLDIEIADILNGKFVCPQELSETSPQTCESEQQLLQARRESFAKKYEVLAVRRQQRNDELIKSNGRAEGLAQLLSILEKERSKIAPLVKRKLHSELNLIQLDRQIIEQSNEIDTVQQNIPLLMSSIKEAELQLEEHELQFKQEARRERSNVMAELSVLRATVKGATDRVKRTDIRSPVDGEVNTLEINTIGAFVQPGTAVAGIVPTTETLLVEARISPKDIAFIQPGQEALVKITAYDFSIFGGIKGVVSNVSADSIVDQESGETFYSVRVETGTSQIGKDGRSYDIRIGMVASVDILTGEKTVLEYMLKPIIKARSEALTER